MKNVLSFLSIASVRWHFKSSIPDEPFVVDCAMLLTFFYVHFFFVFFFCNPKTFFSRFGIAHSIYSIRVTWLWFIRLEWQCDWVYKVSKGRIQILCHRADERRKKTIHVQATSNVWGVNQMKQVNDSASLKGRTREKKTSIFYA